MSGVTYQARFSPRVWANDCALEVSPMGPVTWDCTAFMAGRSESEISHMLWSNNSANTALRTSLAAPYWIRMWDGPFEISVNRLEPVVRAVPAVPQEPPQVLAIIPARAGSRSIPGKNLLQLCGRSLLSYTVDAIKASQHIDYTVALSDDPEFLQLASQHGIPTMIEPPEYAIYGARVEDAIDYAVKRLRDLYGWWPKAVVICEANVPIRPPGIFDRAVELLYSMADRQVEAVYTLESAIHHHPYWSAELRDGVVNFPEQNLPMYRQALPERYQLTTAAYVYRPECILKGLNAIKAAGLIHEPGDCIDIDTPEDLEWAAFRLQRAQR